jgi:hypothetical protein
MLTNQCRQRSLIYDDFGKPVPAIPVRLHDGRLEAELPHLCSPSTTYVVDSPLGSFCCADCGRPLNEFATCEARCTFGLPLDVELPGESRNAGWVCDEPSEFDATGGL